MEQLAVINMHKKRGYKLLVIEDVETNIGEGVKSGIESRAEDFGFDKLFASTKQPAEVKHNHTGSNVIFKGYHSEQQQKQVKSLNEVTSAWYEEAENITYNQFKALRMQLRGGNPEDRQLFLTLNPINSDSFINEYFFQHSPDKVFEYFPDGRPKVFERNITVDLDDTHSVSIPCIVVVSTHWDNPYLTEEQRADIEELKDTDPEMYQMLAEGKFVKPAGTFFKEFDYGVHVCEPFPIPDHWHRYTAKDYGLDRLANLWFAVDTHNNIYCYKELGESDLIISEAAERIKQVNGQDRIMVKYAPPDLDNRRQETGRSAMDIFREHGESCTKASNDRVDGWLAVKELLKVIEVRDEQTGEIVKTARLKIFSNCIELIKCLPQLQRSESNPNDVATEPHDITHMPDALRYFAIMRVRKPNEVSHVRDDAQVAKRLKAQVRNATGGEATRSYLLGGY